uniref:NlpC/P60 domain-containing protein n=1 Tax=Clandestinovirus TaxID=2831644 RepID=A0A8F8KMA3_9VIRU|nr:hypothetical protein KOM_12_494 [Clandestinovirus]
MKYPMIFNGQTVGTLRKEEGRWGNRRHKKLQRVWGDNPRVLDLFIYESSQSVYTSWKFTNDNDEALHLPNHLLLGYAGGKLRSFTVMEKKRGKKYLTKGSFKTTELFLVKTVPGPSRLPKDQLNVIRLPNQMKRRLAKYVKETEFNEKFCCYDLVGYLYGVYRETAAWEQFLPRMTIINSKDAKPGDVIGYVKHGTKEAVHVGIYLGNDLVLSRNGINDCLLVNSVEDMRQFYDYHCSVEEPLDVLYSRMDKEHPLYSTAFADL